MYECNYNVHVNNCSRIVDESRMFDDLIKFHSADEWMVT